jgi:hypothetical protein
LRLKLLLTKVLWHKYSRRLFDLNRSSLNQHYVPWVPAEITGCVLAFRRLGRYRSIRRKYLSPVRQSRQDWTVGYRQDSTTKNHSVFLFVVSFPHCCLLTYQNPLFDLKSLDPLGLQ